MAKYKIPTQKKPEPPLDCVAEIDKVLAKVHAQHPNGLLVYLTMNSDSFKMLEKCWAIVKPRYELYAAPEEGKEK